MRQQETPEDIIDWWCDRLLWGIPTAILVGMVVGVMIAMVRYGPW